jgi:hypothetical protein
LIHEEISTDILLLLCLNYILEIIKKNILSLQKKLTSIILENLSEKDPRKDFDKNLAMQFTEFQKNIETENTKILSNSINKTLKYFNNIEDLNLYLSSYLNFREVLKNIKNENLDYKNLIKKQFFDFISPLLEDKFRLINEALEGETWSAAFIEISEKNNLILQKLQNKIDIIFYKNFNDYKSIVNIEIFNKIMSAENSKNNANSAIEFFGFVNSKNIKSISNGDGNLNNNNNDKKKILNEETISEANANNIENKNIPLNNIAIEFKDAKFKIMNSTITLINCIFETYKILLVCEDSLMPHICDSICSQIRRFLEFHREMVLDGEGVRKGKLKAIYQKEISIVCSNALIIKRFVSLFATSQLLSPIFVDISSSIEVILKTCRVKINELFQLM